MQNDLESDAGARTTVAEELATLLSALEEPNRQRALWHVAAVGLCWAPPEREACQSRVCQGAWVYV